MENGPASWANQPGTLLDGRLVGHNDTAQGGNSLTVYYHGNSSLY